MQKLWQFFNNNPAEIVNFFVSESMFSFYVPNTLQRSGGLVAISVWGGQRVEIENRGRVFGHKGVRLSLVYESYIKFKY